MSSTKCKMKFSKVCTPDLKAYFMNPCASRSTFDQIQKDINKEFKEHKKWTEQCTALFSSNISALYNYDRLSYCMSRAYGHIKYKVLINPKMVFCYHPSCLSKGCSPVSLRAMFDIASYSMHLIDHNSDLIGIAMEKRFKAVVENNFVTDKELDELSVSPYSLNPNLLLQEKSLAHIQRYGIIRDFDGIYICFWKDKFIQAGIIQTSYLTFQEDDALLQCLLKFPDPVRSWSKWPSLSLYSMKLFTSIGSAAVNLYRGIMRSRITKTPAVNVSQFCKEINHPCPSVTTNQHHLPALNYDSKVFHKSELIFHLKLLLKNEEAPCLIFPQAKRFLSTEVIDEQEINQGTFVDNGRLCGLKTPMSSDDIKKIGLSKLADYITTENGFITSVREYRQTDCGGIMCSNSFTSLESGPLDANKCGEQLKNVVDFANSCLLCLTNDLKCNYEKINEPCTNCELNGEFCVSMTLFHILWDMGSSHKKCKSISPQIEFDSPLGDLFNPNMQTIGFGGLHLLKACTNALRNHILAYHGMNYGMNIFRAVKNQSHLLENIKQSVFVAKDRQSDLCSFLTTCPLVQQALSELKSYHVRRVPEPILSYTQNVKTQKEIVSPVALTTNNNGDVFILDKGSTCVHVVDRCVVSKVFLIGRYQTPSLQKYEEKQSALSTSKAMFSEQLVDIVASDQDDIFVLDQGREEIVVVPNVVTAKSVNTKKIHILQLNGVSITYFANHLVVLMKENTGYCIKFVTPLFPNSKKSSLNIQYSTKFSITSHFKLKNIFLINTNILGAVDHDNMICTYELRGKKLVRENSTNVVSECKPCIAPRNQLFVLDKNGHIQKYSFHKNNEKQQVEFIHVEEVSITNVKCFTSWGEVIFLAKQISFVSYCLEEIGSLSFGFQLCKAINEFYEAISYTKPGHGEVIKNLTLRECIEKASSLVSLLRNMTQSLKERFSRNSFQGEFGTPWTATVDCVIDTVDSWKALVRRLDNLDPSVCDKVYSHTVTNEAWIEHSFGESTKQGQGHLQDTKEYVQSKRRVAMDFAIRSTDTPFCQYTKVKIRDKGYQSLVNVKKTKLSMNDIVEIFKPTRTRTIKELDAEENEISEENKLILHKAYLLTKSVPRQSNRVKWRERSGYQPNLLNESNNEIISGDMVFSRGLENELVYLLIQENVVLNGKAETVKVQQVGQPSQQYVPINKLLTDKGQIVVIPSSFYKISEDNKILFKDIVEEQISSFDIAQSKIHSEDDWAVLMDMDTFHDGSTDNMDNVGNFQDMIGEDCIHFNFDPNHQAAGTSNKRKRISVEDDDDINGERKIAEGSFSTGDWIISKYEYNDGKRLKKRCNFYVGQILPDPNLEGEDKIEDDEITVQYYKSEYPQSDMVFTQLPNIEYAKRETIVEKIEKPEILSSGRIKLSSLPKSGKLV